MKPKRIILVRHGESVGNVDKSIYATYPDYAIHITAKGVQQAKEFAAKLRYTIGDETIRFYTSPYYRTRETQVVISRSFPNAKNYEDPRLIEQEWCGSLTPRNAGTPPERDDYGHFYYRFNNGESCCDMYNRISTFLETLYRDFTTATEDNCCIVTHGMTMRVFLMRFFHYTPEEFELLRNPPNCGYYMLKLDKDSDRYELAEPVEKYEERFCKF